jgi:hypothetical protein
MCRLHAQSSAQAYQRFVGPALLTLNDAQPVQRRDIGGLRSEDFLAQTLRLNEFFEPIQLGGSVRRRRRVCRMALNSRPLIHGEDPGGSGLRQFDFASADDGAERFISARRTFRLACERREGWKKGGGPASATATRIPSATNGRAMSSVVRRP